jgi:hypothetical protein
MPVGSAGLEFRAALPECSVPAARGSKLRWVSIGYGPALTCRNLVAFTPSRNALRPLHPL